MADQPTINDPEVPALAFLLGGDAEDVLGSLLAHIDVGIRSASVAQVRYSPGRAITVRYDAVLAAASVTDAERATFVVSAGRPVPDTVTRLAAGDVEVAVWRYPFDPYLPGLAAAADPVAARELIGSFGIGVGSVEVRRRAYRPGRRAVLELQSGATRMFLKVVRPERVEILHRRHRRLAGSLPVPQSLGWSRTHGVVAMQALPGTPLRRLATRAEQPLPGSDELVDLLDRIPPLEWPAADSPVLRVSSHRRLLEAVLPAAAPQLERLETAIRGAAVPPLVSIHGDFHASQILVDQGLIRGVVDVDTAGAGHRADDLAGLVAQLQVLSLTARSPDRLRNYSLELFAGFKPTVPDSDLHLRVAAGIVGFATGPFRVQMDDWQLHTKARLDLADQWTGGRAVERAT